MALAAIEAGVKGLYVEKPFCRAPSEADRLITAADLRGTKIAVAHRNRYHPVISKIGELITSGEIGRLLEIKGHGLGDRRGGGEDLWVLGGHVVACRQAPDSWAGDLRPDSWRTVCQARRQDERTNSQDNVPCRQRNTGRRATFVMRQFVEPMDIYVGMPPHGESS